LRRNLFAVNKTKNMQKCALANSAFHATFAATACKIPGNREPCLPIVAAAATRSIASPFFWCCLEATVVGLFHRFSHAGGNSQLLAKGLTSNLRRAPRQKRVLLFGEFAFEGNPRCVFPHPAT
jgi:hypothetical protein